jgi:hypothetical protein
MGKGIVRRIFKGDKVIWAIFFILCSLSLVEVFSALSRQTYKTHNYWQPITKHALFLIAGVGVVWFIHNMKISFFSPLFIKKHKNNTLKYFNQEAKVYLRGYYKKEPIDEKKDIYPIAHSGNYSHNNRQSRRKAQVPAIAPNLNYQCHNKGPESFLCRQHYARDSYKQEH